MNNQENSDAIHTFEEEAEVDLASFCQVLWKQRLYHRVITNNQRRFLVVSNEADMRTVSSLYQQWSAMTPTARMQAAAVSKHALFRNVLSFLYRFPTTTSIAALALLCYPAVIGLEQGTSRVHWLSITPIELANGFMYFHPLSRTLTELQLWRLVSPVFLHFSVLHLAFNLAIVTDFSRRIEHALGSRFTFLAFLLIAVGSNLVQYLFAPAVLFGGLSGVAYGLVGFVVVMRRMQPAVPQWAVNPSILIAILIFLVVFSTGVTELFNLYIANAAHWTGLIIGVVLALIAHYRIKGER